ncbi:MAG: hypothetical protein AAFQ24_11200, partial [Pseudomonadota bacterium]
MSTPSSLSTSVALGLGEKKAECHMKTDGKSVISLEEVLKAIAPDGLDGPLPPVHLWNPQNCCEFPFEYRRNFA